MFAHWTMLTVFLYVIGLVLIMLEAFIPHFGIAGISGIICVIASIMMVSTNVYEGLLIIIATIALVILVLIALYKMGFGTKFIKFFVLKTEQKKEEGYTSNSDYKRYIGKRGAAVTPLRSAGTVIIDGIRLDAVSEGEFIDRDKIVEVIRVEGRRIIVRAAGDK